MQDRADMANVKFSAVVDLAFGENLYLCGSAPALGSWDLDSAVRMSWSDGGNWSAILPLPCGVSIEFKLVIQVKGSHARWIGAGSSGEENILMETSLARKGGERSRICNCTSLPLSLQIEDLGFSVSDEPRYAGGTSIVCSPLKKRASGNFAQEFSIYTPPRSTSSRGMGNPYNFSDFDFSEYPSPPGRYPAPEVQAAIAAGRSVTVSTTTTKTTCITIGGADHGVGRPRPHRSFDALHEDATRDAGFGRCIASKPPKKSLPYQAASLPALADRADAQRCNGTSLVPSANSGRDAKDRRKEYAAEEARRFNRNLSRSGCAAVAWRQPGATTVRIAGSWDGWRGQVALEPIPGEGFGILLALEPGEYEFKFIVDGNWLASCDYETRGDHSNNVMQVNDWMVIPGEKGHNMPALVDLTSRNSIAITNGESHYARGGA
mmetsp:Transcript_7508/g.13513  ORF Transcript_7508/g.13513 Transcript_7508/m.13513 type:complete len:435 (-) Transcript_7508:229-1533(-)